MMKKTYRVPVEYLQKGYQTVDAESYEDAVQFMLDNAKYLKTPTTSEPVEGTLRVVGEGQYGKDVEAIVKLHEKQGLNMMPQDTAINREMFTETITRL